MKITISEKVEQFISERTDKAGATMSISMS